MDTSFFSSRPIDLKTIFKMNDITPDIQHHLMQVYSALAMTVLAAAAGARISSSSILSGGGDWFWFTAIGTFATLWYIQSTRHQINNTRYAALLLFGLLKGLTIGGLVANALIMDPGIVITAFLGSTTIFLCFSGVALIGKRREFLYLGGFLSSAILCLFVLSLANLFFRSAAIFTAELYIGLIVFVGYVVFDTQMIIESASYGHKDYIWDALNLFTDLAAIFVRLLIILMKKKQANEEKRRRQQQRRS